MNSRRKPSRPASNKGGGTVGRKPSTRSGPKSSGPARRAKKAQGRTSGQRGTTPIRSSRGGGKGRPPARTKGSSAAKSLGGDQVEGRHAVRELLLAGGRRTREVILAADLDEASILNDIIDLADESKVRITQVARAAFEATARTESSQGVIAMAEPLLPVELTDLLETRDGSTPFILVVDGVTDPGNLGAMLRTAECAGVTGVVLPRHRAVHITPTVTKAAAGAIEHLPMALVPGLPAALVTLVELGVWTIGLDAEANTSIHELAVAAEPIALVMGAEGSGLSRLVRERCDALASIPLGGVLGSLNVAAATAVACFEIARHRAQ